MPGIRKLVISDGEAEIMASLLDEFCDGGEELLKDIAHDQEILPVGQEAPNNVDELLEGMSTLLEVTAGVSQDLKRAQTLRRMLRCQP
jgi:hypothetical protein